MEGVIDGREDKRGEERQEGKGSERGRRERANALLFLDG